MSDNEELLPELPEEEAPIEQPLEELPEFPDEDEDDDFFGDDIDPESIVTIRPGSGQARYQTVTEPTPLDIVLQRAGLTWNGQLDAYVEGVQITLSTPVNGGQTVTLIGNVKGG